MSRIVWGATGERNYNVGVDRGVLYVSGSNGVPWNGLVSVDESPENIEVDKYYLDGTSYLTVAQPGEYEGNITAFGCPSEFRQCDGSVSIRHGLRATNQVRKSFDFTYRTYVNTDTETKYQIHLIYGAKAKAPSRAHATISSDVNVETISWDISATPPQASNFRPTAHLIVDSDTAYPWVLSSLENILYGDETQNPRMPTQDEVIELFEESSIVQIVDHGDGTFSIIGPDSLVRNIDETTWEVDTPAVVYLDAYRFTISSL